MKVKYEETKYGDFAATDQEPVKKYSISKLAKDYHVTQRTLRNDLAEINDFLEDLHMPEIYF